MRRSLLLICVLLLAVTAGGFASAAGATSPELAAKRAQANKVIAQIDAIDEQVSVVSERYDSANVALGTLRRRVTAERASLRIAQAQYRVAQRNVARLLVALYTSQQPSALDVILGASSLSGLLKLSETEHAVSREQAELVTAAVVARSKVRSLLESLETDRAAAAATVKELGQERGQIEHRLAQRRTLLSSVQTQINQIEARQRAEQCSTLPRRARSAAGGGARGASSGARRSRKREPARRRRLARKRLLLHNEPQRRQQPQRQPRHPRQAIRRPS